MKRRHFVKHLLTLICSTPLYRVFAAETLPSYPVVIIGAGVAGLSAGQSLKLSGVKSLILEASERIGGRIYTKRSSQGLFEQGANWIHGNKRNPLYDFCINNDIHPLSTPEDVKNDFIYKTNGVRVNPTYYQNKLKWFKKIESKIFKYIKTKDDSLSSIVDQVIQKDHITSEEKTWLEFFLKIYVEENYGASIQDLSAEQFSSPSWFSGGDYILPDGYDRIPALLSKNLDIKTNSPVKSIEKMPSGLFCITFGNKLKVIAKQVLVTVPLGVLKAKSIRFEPTLSAPKVKAIDSVGFGKFTKVFIHISEDKAQALKNHPSWLKTFSSEDQRGFQFFNIVRYTSFSAIIGIAVAQEATALEEMPHEQLRSYILARAPFLAAQDIIKIETTQWTRNEWIRGSYSFPQVGCSESDFNVIGESVGSLHFAGEACQSDVYGTVEAAFISGQRAAKKIVKLN